MESNYFPLHCCPADLFSILSKLFFKTSHSRRYTMNKSNVKTLSASTDRLSDLPREVSDVILARLSIKEAVKTTILSKSWKNSWTSVPDLVFDAESFNLSTSKRVTSEWVDIVMKVFQQHSGTITKFWVEFPEYDMYVAQSADSLIKDLAKSGTVRDLALKFSCVQGKATPAKEKYSIPPPLFSCQNLTRLMLCNCVLNDPPSFGLQHLNFLELNYVSVRADGLVEQILMGCPSLKHLNLNVHGPSSLNINASKLEILYATLNDPLQSLSFDNCGHLVNLVLDVRISKQTSIIGTHKLTSLTHWIWRGTQCYVIGHDSHNLTYRRLARLDIDGLIVNRNMMVSKMLSFAGVCTNLRKLVLRLRFDKRFNEQQQWLNQDIGKWTCLTHIYILDVVGEEIEMNLIEFLLARSPSLKGMAVKRHPDFRNHEEEEKMLKKLYSYPRASREAEFKFCI